MTTFLRTACVLLAATATQNAQAQTPTAARSGPLHVESVTLPGFSSPAFGRWLTPDEDRSGVPLGGLGTGFLELRPDGRIYDARYRGLGNTDEGTSLVLSAAIGSAPAVPLISSVRRADRVPAPHRYFGHYPIADLDYAHVAGLPVSVWCRALAPFVPGDAELSNLPAVFFSVRLKNESARLVPVVLRLLFDPPEAAQSEDRDARAQTGVEAAITRRQGASFALAMKSTDSTVKTRAVPSRNGSMLEVRCRLAASDQKTVTFVLAWHTATETGRDGKSLVPHYAAHYADAGAVARAALSRTGAIESGIVAWQQQVYAGQGPPWLKDALVNGLSLLARNTVWYGDGLYLWEQQGSVIESVGSRLDGGLPLALFFPNMETQALRRLAARQTDQGEIPGRLGQEGSLGAPIFGPGRTLASAEFVLLARRAAMVSGDHAFVTEIFPTVKRAMQFAMTLDRDDDGLIDEPALPKALASLDRYRRDWLWLGTSTYTAFTGLAALRAAEELGRGAGDTEFADWCRLRYESGRRGVEENLWNGHQYRLYTDPDGFRQSETSFIAALAGQAFAWSLDLDELSPTDRLTAALKAAAELHGLNGTADVPGGVLPDGKPDTTGAPYSASTCPRDVWLYTATALYAAEKTRDTGLRDRALETAERAYIAMAQSGTLWRQHSIYRPGDVAPAGDPDYLGNLAVWLLPSALEGKPLHPFGPSANPVRPVDPR